MLAKQQLKCEITPMINSKSIQAKTTGFGKKTLQIDQT